MITLKQVAEQAQQKTEPLSLEKLVEFIGELLPSESAAVWDLVEQRYPKISLEFLSSRTPDGFPRFVPFHPDDPTFMLKGSDDLVGWDMYRIREWSDRFRPWYQDVVARLQGVALEERKKHPFYSRAYRYTASATQRFSGLIPHDVRKEVRAVADAISGGHPFIVAEAGKWEVAKQVETRVDPLVVLIPKVFHPQHGYLVAAFDVTPAEEYIKREFCE